MAKDFLVLKKRERNLRPLESINLKHKIEFSWCLVLKNILQFKVCQRLASLNLFKTLTFGSGLKFGLDGQFCS